MPEENVMSSSTEIDTLRKKLMDISFYRSDSQTMNDAIDRLVVKVHHRQQTEGKNAVLLTGCGSACGTTSMAINLSIALSIAGWNTLLVDLDFRKSNRHKTAARNAPNGLADILTGELFFDDALFATNHERLYYVPSGEAAASSVRLLCSENMGGFVLKTREKFDFVVYDCPSITVVPDAEVLSHWVDGIALIAALSITTKRQLADAKTAVSKFGDKYFGMIVNCVDDWQYQRMYPQHDYFDTERLNKAHKRFSKTK